MPRSRRRFRARSVIEVAMRWRAHVRHHRVWALVALGLVVGAPVGRTAVAQQSASTADTRAHPAKRSATHAVAVTPVEGPSTLHHLRLSIERSSMGWGGQWGPARVLPPPPDRGRRVEDLTLGFVLNGADLYRVSCRACHRADGSGGPPEIHSLIGPVQSASFQWMVQRMKAMERPADTLTPRLQERSRKAGPSPARSRSLPQRGHLSDLCDPIRLRLDDDIGGNLHRWSEA